MTDSSAGRLHRTTFFALKHTCSSHYPAVYLDSGLSFDASLQVHRREDLALRWKVAVVLRGTSSSSSWGAGGGEGTSLQPLRKQDGGETLLGMTDSGTRQLHRTTFCALKHTRSSPYPFH